MTVSVARPGGHTPPRTHGGPDGVAAAAHDFSTCANAAGPCPQALRAVRSADPTRYPDPQGTALRLRLARRHGVAPERVLLAASASEFIQRITAMAARLGVQAVQVPRLAYGDYAAAAQACGLGGMTDTRGGGGFWDRVQHLILPTISLGLVSIGGWSSYIRTSMLETLGQDFIRTAHAKGLAERSVLFGHAFRNAFLPLVTLVGLSLPGLFGGAVIVESIFAWNGIGRLTIEAVQRRDYTLIMGTTLMFAVLTVVANLLADVSYAIIDPRVRLE